MADCSIPKAADDKKRQVIISSLPTETTFSDIFSIIWGGKVESVEYIPQSTQASALFTSNEACARYLKATRGGISNAFNDDDRIIQIELGTSPDPKVFSSDHHGSNRSRCIEITGSIIGWRDVEELEALASNHDCSIESLELRKKCKVCFFKIVQDKFTLLTCNIAGEFGDSIFVNRTCPVVLSSL